MPTKTQVTAAINAIFALSEAIREAKSIPSGHLYAVVMNHMDHHTYESFIDRLVDAGLVSRKGDVLVWVGPEIES